ncbi:hemopexin repeat-containing protein [Methanosarcina sp. Mfa9]|uniref:hemopexin repeat-containing protein n=1 Tax=Methanosarcina sp. Mfa9 TaxID=3439063 RepID=UPI003F848EA7
MSKFYIFHGDEYVRHSYGRGPDAGYPKKIQEVWSGYPSSWRRPNVRIDAALYYPGNDKFYIFHRDEYVRHSYGRGPDAGYPKKIQEVWSGYPSSWRGPSNRIDAALYYPGNDKFYIFHEDEYVRHSYGRGPDTGYPKKIQEVWSAWPSSWTSSYVQVALYHPDNEKFYIFQNDEYVRHSYNRGADPGYPKKIGDVWSGWPSEWNDPPGEHLTRFDAALSYPHI